jgi:hypothetical protein
VYGLLSAGCLQPAEAPFDLNAYSMTFKIKWVYVGHLFSFYLLRVKTEGRRSLSDISVWLQPEANSWSVNSVDTIHIWKQHYCTVVH